MAVSKAADADGGMRFQLLNDDEMVTFTDSANSDNTKKQIKYSVSIFDGYCEQAGVDFHFLDNTELDNFFRSFMLESETEKGSIQVSVASLKVLTELRL